MVLFSDFPLQLVNVGVYFQNNLSGWEPLYPKESMAGMWGMLVSYKLPQYSKQWLMKHQSLLRQYTSKLSLHSNNVSIANCCNMKSLLYSFNIGDLVQGSPLVRLTDVRSNRM